MTPQDEPPFTPTSLGQLGDPAAELTALHAASAAGQRPHLFLFFGHRGNPGTVGRWVLSQWWPTGFTINGVTYPNAEVAMMAAKARLFGDRDVWDRLAGTTDPKTAKALGRKVRGFDQRIWDEHAYRLVVEANLAKFSQSPPLRDYLLSTAPAVLVEASPYDRIWGIGLNPSDPRAQSPRQWRGRNLLGFALTEVRRQLTGG